MEVGLWCIVLGLSKLFLYGEIRPQLGAISER
jgi:hypothetical protein